MRMRLVNLEEWDRGFQDGVECATEKKDTQKYAPPFSRDFVDGFHAGYRYATTKGDDNLSRLATALAGEQ